MIERSNSLPNLRTYCLSEQGWAIVKTDKSVCPVLSLSDWNTTGQSIKEYWKHCTYLYLSVSPLHCLVDNLIKTNIERYYLLWGPTWRIKLDAISVWDGFGSKGNGGRGGDWGGEGREWWGYYGQGRGRGLICPTLFFREERPVHKKAFINPSLFVVQLC